MQGNVKESSPGISSRHSYPLGLSNWTVRRSASCSNGTVELHLTACQEDQFNCKAGWLKLGAVILKIGNKQSDWLGNVSIDQ